jgi:uncharacterized protein
VANKIALDARKLVSHIEQRRERFKCISRDAAPKSGLFAFYAPSNRVLPSLTHALTHAAMAPAINSAPCFTSRVPLSETFPVTDRTRIVREPVRAVYDRDAIYKILDEALTCHVGFSTDGQPFVIPTMFARLGDAIYFHGSAASRTLRGLSSGLPVCIAVTLSDGLVLARSVFNHSMNYRSVVALGKATLIDDPAEKLQALQAFTEKLIPGRWADARQPNEKELKATNILKLPLTEVSAKVRVGDVEDDAPDYELPVWAGVIPLRLVADAPIRDSRCDDSIPAPNYALHYRR